MHPTGEAEVQNIHAKGCKIALTYSEPLIEGSPKVDKAVVDDGEFNAGLRLRSICDQNKSPTLECTQRKIANGCYMLY